MNIRNEEVDEKVVLNLHRKIRQRHWKLVDEIAPAKRLITPSP